MDEDWCDAIESSAILLSIGIIIWMIIRACEAGSYSHKPYNEYSGFLKTSLLFSILVPLIQISIGIIAIFNEYNTQENDNIPDLLTWDYILFIEYVIILFSGWLVSCYIMILHFQNNYEETKDKSLIVFWGYYCILHLSCGILRLIIIVGNETYLKLAIMSLHFIAGLMCLMLEIICICAILQNFQLSNSIPEPNISIKDLKESFQLRNPISASIKHAKITDNINSWVIISKIDGQTYQVTRTPKHFEDLNFKVFLYKGLLKKVKFNKFL